LGIAGGQTSGPPGLYVKPCLLLNYFGQAVWLLQHNGRGDIDLNVFNPFYQIMPPWFLIFGIGIATVAAVIACQAVISSSFTLIAEAVRLNLWPKVKIGTPAISKRPAICTQHQLDIVCRLFRRNVAV
jgi:KUP system potassium uptake protein